MGNNMVKKILYKIKKYVVVFFAGDISITKYIYYNYFCKNIVRQGKNKIVPHKNTVLDLSDKSRIYLSGTNNIILGYNKLKKSRSETHVRLEGSAIWYCRNGADLFYDTVLEIKDGAILDTGFFSANGGSVIIADKKITFGEDVMIGRNVVIYDSDFHTLYNNENKPVNPPKPVVIEDHVWLTSNITVLKGVTIGRDSLITAQTVINKNMPSHSIIGGKSVGNVIKDSINWGRSRCPKE